MSGPEIDPQEARDALWRLGVLRFLLLPHQGPLYRFLDPRPVAPGQPLVRVANCSRRIGKSTVGLLRSSERCIQKPRAQVRYAAGTAKELRKITIPIIRKLIERAPQDVRPRWLQFDHVFEFPNGSQIHMAGSDNENADALRGTESDLNLVEEAGHVDDLAYLVEDVLLPQTLTTLAPTFLVGTPPRTPAHDFAAFAAQARNAYLEMTIDENTSISDLVRAAYAEEAGGVGSTTWQREYLCQFVVDEETAVVPEFMEGQRWRCLVSEAPAPTYESPLVAMDVGFADFHVVLYGYWNFREAKLVVQAEDVLQRATTDKIAAAMKATEDRLWGPGKRKGNRGPMRWSDTDLRLIEDLYVLHKLAVSPTAKDDKEAQVNALRLLVKDEKIQIDPSCVTLVRQLKTAVWRDNRREFERTKSEGHFDAVDALIYMVRNANRHENPYPSLPEGVTPQTHWISPRRPEQQSEEARAFGEALRRRA